MAVVIEMAKAGRGIWKKLYTGIANLPNSGVIWLKTIWVYVMNAVRVWRKTKNKQCIGYANLPSRDVKIKQTDAAPTKIDMLPVLAGYKISDRNVHFTLPVVHNVYHDGYNRPDYGLNLID